jgi:hypothetical protein
MGCGRAWSLRLKRLCLPVAFDANVLDQLVEMGSIFTEYFERHDLSAVAPRNPHAASGTIDFGVPAIVRIVGPGRSGRSQEPARFRNLVSATWLYHKQARCRYPQSAILFDGCEAAHLCFDAISAGAPSSNITILPCLSPNPVPILPCAKVLIRAPSRYSDNFAEMRWRTTSGDEGRFPGSKRHRMLLVARDLSDKVD